MLIILAGRPRPAGCSAPRRGELAYVLLQVNAFIQPAESSLAEKEARVDAP